MPRVHEVKAAKDYPAEGIKKGETYYWWKFRYGGKRRSKTYPRPSQLTQNDKLIRMYSAQERIGYCAGVDLGADDLASIFEEVREAVEELVDEFEEAADNIEEHFPDGTPQSEESRERANTLRDVESELGDIISELEEYTDTQCQDCDGSGYILMEVELEDGEKDGEEVLCNECDGTGERDCSEEINELYERAADLSWP